MKLMVAAFLLASSLCLASSANIERRGVKDIEKAKMELISMLKWDVLIKVGMEYLYRDPQVQELARYVNSAEFKDVILGLDATSEYQEVLDYMKKAGIHAVKVHNVLHAGLGLPTLPVVKDERDVPIIGGVMGLMQDLLGAIDKDALMGWHDQNKSSELLQALLNLPNQPFIQTLVPKLANLPQVKVFVEKMKSLGLQPGAIPAFHG